MSTSRPHATGPHAGAIGVVMAMVVAVAVACLGCTGDTSNAASGRFTPLHADTLTVATDFPAAGFWEGRDVDHISGGFEYDLAVELADQLDLDRVRVVNVAFDDLVAGEAGGFDLGLAQVSITSDRSEVVDFSEPYLTTPVGVVGTPGLDVPDLAEGRTLRWAVAEATTEVDVVDDVIRPETDADVLPTTADALDAVVDRWVDVAAIDYVRALAEVAADSRLALTAQITAPQNLGAVLPKGSSNFEAVNAAIRRLAADGTLDRLRDDLYDHYGVDQNDVPTLRVTP